ncbi:hypothetical protein [Desulfovibrio inopinatus]|uniref:hypothetical protein n=1 Tax=Desulfovibrio inopinatus TaxID=102109 RepID=UPI000409AFB9|nr:hypothetical protein [Desulfovibrio inopinatus]
MVEQQTAQKGYAPEQVQKVLDGEITIKEALKLDDSIEEAMYLLAYTKMQSGHWGEAFQALGVLSALNPADPRYPKGMGVCLQQIGQYGPAAFYFLWSNAIDESDPSPLLDVAQCYTADGDNDHARMALELFLKKANELGGYEDKVSQAEVMMANIF